VKMALGGKTALGQEAKAYHVTKASQQLVCLLFGTFHSLQ